MRPFQIAAAAVLVSTAVTFRPPHPPTGGPANAVSIRDYGAKGDGSTDDTSAVVKTFAAVCAAGGGAIFIPAGIYIVDPASASIPLCSSLLVSGPGTLKVKPNAGNYGSMFAPVPPSAAVNDVTFTGITIDQNTFENRTAIIVVADKATRQDVWRIFGGTNLHFEGMRLYVSGVNPINVNAPTLSGVYIARNHIIFQKRPDQPAFDNSTIYIDGDDFHVSDNTFMSTLADAAQTAIEIHSGAGSVSGNTVDGYVTGMNLVDLHSASAFGNVVRNAERGVSLWSIAAMDSLILQANTIALDQVARASAASWGIATVYDPDMHGSFTNLQIAANLVSFQRETAARPISAWVNYGIGLQARGTITNALIVGNEIVQPPVRGIVVGAADAGYTTSGVTVRNNRIVDAGSSFSRGAADYSAAVAIQGNLSAIDVVQNRIDFRSNPFAGHYSFWSREAGFTYRDVVVADNYATATAGTPVMALTGSVIQTLPH